MLGLLGAGIAGKAIKAISKRKRRKGKVKRQNERLTSRYRRQRDRWNSSRSGRQAPKELKESDFGPKPTKRGSGTPLGAGLAAWSRMKRSSPRPKRRPRKRKAPIGTALRIAKSSMRKSY